MLREVLALFLLSVMLSVAASTLCVSDADCEAWENCYENVCTMEDDRVKRVFKIVNTRSGNLFCESDKDCHGRTDYRNICIRNQCSPLWLNRLRSGR